MYTVFTGESFDEVIPGIESVYATIKEGRFKVVDLPCMSPLWDEFATYQYKEDASGQFTDEIADKDRFDVMDMVRYGIATREKRPKTYLIMSE